jgi:hypothetical protein
VPKKIFNVHNTVRFLYYTWLLHLLFRVTNLFCFDWNFPRKFPFSRSSISSRKSKGGPSLPILLTEFPMFEHYINQLSFTVTNTWDNQLIKRKGLLFTQSFGGLRSWLVSPAALGPVAWKHIMVGSTWQSQVTHFMLRKQKKEERFGAPQSPPEAYPP